MNVQIASQPAAVTEGLAVEMGGAGPAPVCCRSVFGSGPDFSCRTSEEHRPPTRVGRDGVVRRECQSAGKLEGQTSLPVRATT